MSEKSKNPFHVADPEKVLQERMKHARRMTREEFIRELKPKEVTGKKSSGTSK